MQEYVEEHGKLLVVPSPACGDRGREGRLPGLPSLRTVRAYFTHTALRSVVLPDEGTEHHVGALPIGRTAPRAQRRSSATA